MIQVELPSHEPAYHPDLHQYDDMEDPVDMSSLDIITLHWNR